MIPFFWFDVGHERGEVFDTCIISTSCLVVRAIGPTSFQLEKVDVVWVWLGGDVDRCSCFPFVIPEGEKVDADLEFVFDCGYLVVRDWVYDLVEHHFGVEALVAEWLLGIFGSRVKGIQHSISKATVIRVVEINDRMLLVENVWQLP